MKTLVIIGAARKNGHTRQMVDLFLEHLDGERKSLTLTAQRYSRAWTAVSAGRKKNV